MKIAVYALVALSWRLPALVHGHRAEEVAGSVTVGSETERGGDHVAVSRSCLLVDAY